MARIWEARNIWLNTFGKGANSWTAYGISPGYDDTVNRGSHGFVIPSKNENRSTYDLQWESALRYPPNLVLVTTFNEFFEGTGIEPTTEFGSQLLTDTRLHAAQLKKIG